MIHIPTVVSALSDASVSLYCIKVRYIQHTIHAFIIFLYCVAYYKLMLGCMVNEGCGEAPEAMLLIAAGLLASTSNVRHMGQVRNWWSSFPSTRRKHASTDASFAHLEQRRRVRSGLQIEVLLSRGTGVVQ